MPSTPKRKSQIILKNSKRQPISKNPSIIISSSIPTEEPTLHDSSPCISDKSMPNSFQYLENLDESVLLSLLTNLEREVFSLQLKRNENKQNIFQLLEENEKLKQEREKLEDVVEEIRFDEKLPDIHGQSTAVTSLSPQKRSSKRIRSDTFNNLF